MNAHHDHHDLTTGELDELSGSTHDLAAHAAAEIRRYRAIRAEIDRRIAALPPGFGATRTPLELCAQLLEGSRQPGPGTALPRTAPAAPGSRPAQTDERERRAAYVDPVARRTAASDAYRRLISTSLELEHARGEERALSLAFWGAGGELPEDADSGALVMSRARVVVREDHHRAALAAAVALGDVGALELDVDAAASGAAGWSR